MEISLGTVLVTGGCGCVGFHVVKELLDSRSCSAIHVFSRNPTRNLLPGVQYHAGSLTSIQDIQNVLQEIQPTTIFHVASPISSGNDANNKLYYDTNVQGTKHLLDCARNLPSVKAFVYTSSSSVAQEPYHFATEDRPLVTRTSGSNYYSTTKAIADESVLKANDPAGGFRTVCLRIGPVYGERDNQMIPGMLKVLHDKRQHMQIGKNTSLFDVVSATNAASAHILAAKALLRARSFWDFSRKIWKAAGDQTPKESIKVVPGWLVLGVAIAVEWLYWIFTFGQKTPKFLRSHTIRWVISERTFSVEKAKQRLGYKPVNNEDESIKKGVEWCLQQEKKEKS